MKRLRVKPPNAGGAQRAETLVKGLKLLIVAASAAAALAVGLGAHAGSQGTIVEAQNSAGY
jgi:hypothetical protein